MTAQIIALLALVALASCQQLPCGFSCSTRTTIQTNIDGQFSTASCSDGNVASRCSGCCIARGLQAGIQSQFSIGFPSTNGACVCCFNNNNNNCGGGNGGGPVFFSANGKK